MLGPFRGRPTFPIWVTGKGGKWAISEFFCPEAEGPSMADWRSVHKTSMLGAGAAGGQKLQPAFNERLALKLDWLPGLGSNQ